MPSLHNLPAPAKINLFLHVTGRRQDGHHLLQSVFMLIDWQDTLHIETRSDGQLRRHDLNVGLPDDDLCLKAARLLQAESRTSQGCDIRIHKEVPWGAGLGGGSSDAATVLLALNQLWGLNWPRSHLEALAVKLGADVPFFVRGHNAWVEGIGESITPIALPTEVLNTPLALLKPPVAVPTVAIFGNELLKRDTKHAIVEDFLAAPRRFGRNDLQAPAESYSGQISQALEIMQNRFGNSRMTGSGSTVFSWMSTDTNSQTPTFQPADLGLNDPAWVGRVSRGLIQHPLLDLLDPIPD
ncbi:4-diphosphocytidyl-2C-methyl-D-erythritol kinase [Aquabacterium sp. NJ1]|uniref:4-(cytidine 5'-diphospho)-2-C-methyl-D-erythritol kinase n=1 Tax=Aquabacterium sp. NJ1 TaxID=1538295 RepID=UPI00052D9E25|nr:4-(cytidine 5'-diphospho)-2-C-methyl-D-erythritol kinase [Aquabacterium sp. NJ1]KGM39428.1 4-diphosphocytidyl-2C-methyl-D-erythritol kinase [Aquabacterium sp. NJ1]